MRRRHGGSPAALRVLAGWTGLAVGLVSLLAPSPYFSVRLAEDAGLFFVSAPLLLAGCPSGWLRRLLHPPGVLRVLHALTRPLPATAMFHVLFVLALLGPYLAAERASAIVLIGVRMLLLALALLMWWPLLSPTRAVPRLGIAMQFVYILVNWLVVTAVFGWLLFSAAAGAAYAGRPGVYGIPAAQDRELGAFALGLVSHVAYALIGLAVYLRWVRTEEALSSPLSLYERVRRAGFEPHEAEEIAGMRRR